MNFEFTDDQVQLRDSVARLLSDVYSFEQRRAITASESGWSPAVWRQLGALGVTGLCIPEDCGGFGGSAADLLPVLQLLGQHLVVEPFLSSAVLSASALSLAAQGPLREQLLPQVASGEHIVAWAHDEPASRHAPVWVEAAARQQDGRWFLDGAKLNVLHAPAAHRFVVTARVSGAPGDRTGLALFLVDAKADGLRMRTHRLVDDTPAAQLDFDRVAAEPLGDPADGARAWAAIEQTLKRGTAAVCADAVGAMQGAYDLTVAYLNTRKQFGRLIGEYQALRHRAAEMLVNLEICRSMAMLAAAAIDDPESVEDTDLMSAKFIIGRHGRNLCHSAIQLHGGIGMTEEYAVGHCLRRISVLDQLFGDSASQASRLAQALETTH